MEKQYTKIIIQLLIICMIGGLAFSLREYSAQRMIADFDEPFYLNLALKYTNAIRDGDYSQIAWIRKNAEHPILAKLIFAFVLIPTPRVDQIYEKDVDMLYPVSEDAKLFVLAARRSSEVFGTITAILLGILNPFAGFIIAIQNTAIHYTSTIYLEAFPALMSTCAVLCYIAWRKKYDPSLAKKTIEKNDLWFLASAVFFAWAIAGKYVFGIAGIAIGLDYIWLHLKHRQYLITVINKLVIWAFLIVVVFFISNPILWPKPLDRFLYSIQYHINYSQSEAVSKYNYPFWQPFVWLVSQNKRYHNAFIFNPDVIILILAFLGLPIIFKKYRVMAIWLVMTLAFLLIWDTKWPQYIMMLVTPLCLSAGLALQEIVNFIKRRIVKKSIGVSEAAY